MEGFQGGLANTWGFFCISAERRRKRLCFPFKHRAHRCSLGFLLLEKRKFVEASRNNPGLLPKDPGAPPPLQEAHGPDAGEVRLLEVNDSPVAG